MKQRGVGLGWGKRSVSLDSDMILLSEQKGRIIIVISSSIIVTLSSIIIVINTRRPLVAMQINGPGVVGNMSGVGVEQLLFFSECCAGLTELCLADPWDECHSTFLQPFQTGLDNSVFDPILEATGDAISEPGWQSLHRYLRGQCPWNYSITFHLRLCAHAWHFSLCHGSMSLSSSMFAMDLRGE